MCKWNTDVVVELPDNIDTGRQSRSVSLDRCIANVIPELWDAGFETLGCCCGHDKAPPNVIIANGHSLKDIQSIAKILERVDGRDWDILQWRLTKVAKSSPFEYLVPLVPEDEIAEKVIQIGIEDNERCSSIMTAELPVRCTLPAGHGGTKHGGGGCEWLEPQADAKADREAVIEAAKEYEALYHANPHDNRFYPEMMADFCIEGEAELLNKLRSKIVGMDAKLKRDDVLATLDYLTKHGIEPQGGEND